MGLASVKILEDHWSEIKKQEIRARSYANCKNLKNVDTISKTNKTQRLASSKL